VPPLSGLLLTVAVTMLTESAARQQGGCWAQAAL
jgi:hypothetical protein